VRALVACLSLGLVLAGCSSDGSRGKPAPSAAPSFLTFDAGPPASARGGPTMIDDGPVPTASPLPVASTPPGPPKASCDMRTKRAICVDYYRPAPTDKSDCESAVAGGTYAASPCPSDKTIGYCTTLDGDRRHYYDGKVPEGFGSGIEDAKLSCESRRFMPVK